MSDMNIEKGDSPNEWTEKDKEGKVKMKYKIVLDKNNQPVLLIDDVENNLKRFFAFDQTGLKIGDNVDTMKVLRNEEKPQVNVILDGAIKDKPEIDRINDDQVKDKIQDSTSLNNESRPEPIISDETLANKPNEKDELASSLNESLGNLVPDATNDLHNEKNFQEIGDLLDDIIVKVNEQIRQENDDNSPKTNTPDDIKQEDENESIKNENSSKETDPLIETGKSENKETIKDEDLLKPDQNKESEANTTQILLPKEDEKSGVVSNKIVEAIEKPKDETIIDINGEKDDKNNFETDTEKLNNIEPNHSNPIINTDSSENDKNQDSQMPFTKEADILDNPINEKPAELIMNNVNEVKIEPIENINKESIREINPLDNDLSDAVKENDQPRTKLEQEPKKDEKETVSEEIQVSKPEIIDQKEIEAKSDSDKNKITNEITENPIKNDETMVLIQKEPEKTPEFLDEDKINQMNPGQSQDSDEKDESLKDKEGDSLGKNNIDSISSENIEKPKDLEKNIEDTSKPLLDANTILPTEIQKEIETKPNSSIQMPIPEEKQINSTNFDPPSLPIEDISDDKIEIIDRDGPTKDNNDLVPNFNEHDEKKSNDDQNVLSDDLAIDPSQSVIIDAPKVSEPADYLKLENEKPNEDSSEKNLSDQTNQENSHFTTTASDDQNEPKKKKNKKVQIVELPSTSDLEKNHSSSTEENENSFNYKDPKYKTKDETISSKTPSSTSTLWSSSPIIIKPKLPEANQNDSNKPKQVQIDDSKIETKISFYPSKHSTPNKNLVEKKADFEFKWISNNNMHSFERISKCCWVEIINNETTNYLKFVKYDDINGLILFDPHPERKLFYQIMNNYTKTGSSLDMLTMYTNGNWKNADKNVNLSYYLCQDDIIDCQNRFNEQENQPKSEKLSTISDLNSAIVNMNKALEKIKNKIDEYNNNPVLVEYNKPNRIEKPKVKEPKIVSALIIINHNKKQEKFNEPVNEHINKNLTNYWPLNSNSTDTKSNLNLRMCKNMVFVKDNTNLSAALSFKNSYAIAPNGVYFSNHLTISAWVKLNSLNNNSTRLIDFGDEKLRDNVIASLSFGSSGRPYFQVNRDGVEGKPVVSNVALEIDKWEHLAFTLKEGRVKIYINGELAGRGLTEIPRNIKRTSNLIGIQNGLTSKEEIAKNKCDFQLMDLKFFNKALNQFDVISSMTDRFSN